MNVTTFEATIIGGLVRFEKDVYLPDATRVFVVVPEFDETAKKKRFDLAEMVSRMPVEYVASEVNFGDPVGKEEW